MMLVLWVSQRKHSMLQASQQHVQAWQASKRVLEKGVQSFRTRRSVNFLNVCVLVCCRSVTVMMMLSWLSWQRAQTMMTEGRHVHVASARGLCVHLQVVLGLLRLPPRQQWLLPVRLLLLVVVLLLQGPVLLQ